MAQAPEEAGFAGLLQELNLVAQPGFEQAIRVAAAVQQRRIKTEVTTTDEVTRTAVLIAVGRLDSQIRSRLEVAGLDWNTLHSIVRLTEFPSPDETAPDLPPGDLLVQALRRFGDTYPNHPAIGSVELALAIVDSVAEDPTSGLLPKRLVDSGLDVAAAKTYLAELLATPAPSTVFDLETFLQRDLAITAISSDAEETVVALLDEEEVQGWGVGPALRQDDFVLMYVPKKLVTYVGGSRPGFYALYRVAAPTEPADGEDVWRHNVDLAGRVRLDPPISIDEMREHEILRDWPLLKSNFQYVGQQKEPVGEREKRALGELIRERVAVVPSPAEAVVLRGAASIGDEPATEDLLGRDDLVQALAAMLDHPSQGTPFTIGLLGDWGSDKTSVMQLLERELGGTPEGGPALVKEPPKRRHAFTFAWFNAWQYEKTGNLAAGLAQETVKALVEGLKPLDRWWLQIRFAWSEYRWRFAGTLVALLAQAALAVAAAVLALDPKSVNIADNVVARLFGGTVAIGSAALLVRLFMRARELWSHPLADRIASYLKLPDYEKHLGLIPVLHRHLKTLCHLRGIRRDRVKSTKDVKIPTGAAAGSGVKKDADRRRLVVFVDDLDRCDSQAIVETFDAIRLVMVIPEVVLIVGIDARIAFRAVGNHYRSLGDELASPQDIARDFLGKIIQLPIRLGRPDNLTDFVQGLFASSRGHERSFTAEHAVAPPAAEAAAQASHPGSRPSRMGTEDQPDVKEEGDTPPRQAEVEKEAARTAIRVELDRDMEHSSEESGQFEELAKIFEIYNPRKLLRLRNSYRLLKLFDLQLARRSPEHEGADPSLLMASLFWQEFLFGCSEALRTACEEAVKRADSTKVSDTAAKNVVESFLLTLKENPDWRDGLDRTRDSVRRLVLPRGHTSMPRTPRASARKER